MMPAVLGLERGKVEVVRLACDTGVVEPANITSGQIVISGRQLLFKRPAI